MVATGDWGAAMLHSVEVMAKYVRSATVPMEEGAAGSQSGPVRPAVVAPRLTCYRLE